MAVPMGLGCSGQTAGLDGRPDPDGPGCPSFPVHRAGQLFRSSCWAWHTQSHRAGSPARGFQHWLPGAWVFYSSPGEQKVGKTCKLRGFFLPDCDLKYVYIALLHETARSSGDGGYTPQPPA